MRNNFEDFNNSKFYEFIITGVVQGVGFRPFIYKNAKQNNIKGFVQNIGEGVRIITNDKEKIKTILEDPPNLSKIDTVDINEIEVSKIEHSFSDFDKTTFKILDTGDTINISKTSFIPPDLNICENCINELFDKENFRYKYFFISCTNCGPRYSLTEKNPYDRKNTSLKNFEMCDNCENEYNDPENRRYHTQTIACEKCGPKLTLYKKCGLSDYVVEDDKNPLDTTIDLLNNDKIVAIKGIGGFHLVCNTKENTINRLKELTKRYDKPFALMTKNIDSIEKYCYVNEKEKELLTSMERPIVILNKKVSKDMSHISELSTLGFMLPYTPTHYMIFDKIDEPLVFTSANMPGLPMTTSLNEQFCNYVLDYNREIINFTDDSIIKVVNNYSLIIRRSRGFVPKTIKIPNNYEKYKDDIISVGAELKSTMCIKKDKNLILSQHIGDTKSVESFDNFKKTFNKFVSYFNPKSNVIIRDKNQHFNTFMFSHEYSQENSLESFSVQHHIAHGYSVALEHNIDDFVSIVCDGAGYGDDGCVWGGEVFHNDKRIGHLEYQNLVGCDLANKEPIRILIGILSNFLNDDELNDFFKNKFENKYLEQKLTLENFDLDKLITVVIKQKEQNYNCALSSSCGRVLDCISILLGFSLENTYEGRCAMLLESNTQNNPKDFPYLEPIVEKDDNNLLILKTTPLFKFLYENINKYSKNVLAYSALIYLSEGFFKITKEYNNNLPIVFSGGCAYNNTIANFMINNNVYLNKEVPCGDGGISLGQIAYYLWLQSKHI